MSAKKYIFKNHQSPGDIVMLLYGIASLHRSHPGKFITDVQCPARELFEGSKFITPLDEKDPEVTVLKCDYPDIHKSNTHPVRFATAFGHFIEEQLGVQITPTVFSGLIEITPQEQQWYSAIKEMLGRDVPYWIINAGHKQDFTAKAWSFARYQELINRFPDVWFVQVGSKEHVHPDLTGPNLINMIGKTDTRQLVRLVYHSFGVISGVSFPMHLSYAVPPHPRFKRRSRASIVIAGGREPAHWEQGPDQQFLHTCGMLPCCDQGGCWKSRVVPLNDGDSKDKSLCSAPVMLEDGQWIGQCMFMIEVDDVARAISRYMDNLDYEPKK
jgi:hypothetical protein